MNAYQTHPAVGTLSADLKTGEGIEHATAFLAALDPAATTWTFQTFDDSPDKRPELAATRHGTLEQHAAWLAAQNARGAGVFVTVNETDGQGRKASNVTRARALFADFDNPEPDALERLRADHLPPSIIVESSTGKWHAYWVSDALELGEFSALQKGVIAHWGSDKSVNDLPRVMRLPGFQHRKGEPQQVRLLEVTGNRYGRELADRYAAKVGELLEQPSKSAAVVDLTRAMGRASSAARTAAEIAEILTYISPSCAYGDWLAVLMGVHDATSGSAEGLGLVDAWSAKGSNYPGPEEIAYKWRTFTKGSTTFATVCEMARQTGADLRDIARRHSPSSTPTSAQPARKARTAAEILEAAEAATTDTPTSAVEALAAEAAALSELDQDKVLRAIKRSTGQSLGALRQVLKNAEREHKRNARRPALSAVRCVPLECFPDVAIHEETGAARLQATIQNIEAMLHFYGIHAAYDVIAKKVRLRVPNLKGSPDNADNSALTHVASLARKNDIPTDQKTVAGYVSAIADCNQVNPVADWIACKPWDGVDRITALCNTLEVADGYPVELRDALLRRWLVSAVAAALQPDDTSHALEGLLVLLGPQGAGKTSWIRRLGGDDPILSKALVKIDHLLDPADKDSVTQAVSHWIVELGELDATLRKADIARLKGFLTRDVDTVRRPYAALDNTYKRRTVFAASVNERNFLADDTGNRRFWTLDLARVDYRHTIDMQQLWAQVKTVWEQGEQWWLTSEERELLERVNGNHRATSAIRELIAATYNGSADRMEWRRLSAAEVLLEIGYDRPTNPQCKEAGAALRELYGEPAQAKGRARFLVPPKGADYPVPF